MARNVVFQIDPQGEKTRVRGLHAEGFHLQRLGTLRVRRASHVDFDEAEQRWTARDHETGAVIARDEERARCIEAEVVYYTKRLDSGHHPFRHWKARRILIPLRRLGTHFMELVRKLNG